jgi:hypothetical protein
MFAILAELGLGHCQQGQNVNKGTEKINFA